MARQKFDYKKFKERQTIKKILTKMRKKVESGEDITSELFLELKPFIVEEG